MRAFGKSSLAAALLALTAGSALAEPNPRGTWMRDDGNARVKIEPCGGDLCATNVWIKDTSGGEEVGDRLVMSVKPVDDNTLDGSAYDAKRDMNFKIKIDVSDNSLTTRGCVVGGLLCKSMGWSKVGGD